MLHRVLPWLWRLADEDSSRPELPSELQQQLLDALHSCPAAEDLQVWHLLRRMGSPRFWPAVHYTTYVCCPILAVPVCCSKFAVADFAVCTMPAYAGHSAKLCVMCSQHQHSPGALPVDCDFM